MHATALESVHQSQSLQKPLADCPQEDLLQKISITKNKKKIKKTAFYVNDGPLMRWKRAV